MNEIVPFAYARSGQVIALADGPELLIYSGSNDQGMWKVMAPDILMGVGYTKEQVVAVDGAGRLYFHRLIDGLEQGRVDTDSSPWGLVVAPEGDCLLLTAGSILLVRRGQSPVEIPLSSPRHAAFSKGAGRVLVGGADGGVTLLDVATGEVVVASTLAAPIVAVRWRSTGQWAVAHGSQIDLLDGETLEPQKSLLIDEPIRRFSLSEDGSVAAVQVADGLVKLFELAGDLPVGEVEFQRTLYGLEFGPATWLAFGFDDGDANRLDVMTGKMTRTQAHIGRGQNAWAMNVRVNHAAVRGVVVGMAAGGQAIAKHNIPKIPKKRSKWWVYAIVAVVVFIALTTCCGLFGGLGVFVLW